MIEWTIKKENIGKKASHLDCFYCGLDNDKVEAAGMWYCPNPRCSGPGAAWFRVKLHSYKDGAGGGHSINPGELEIMAEKYIKENNIEINFS